MHHNRVSTIYMMIMGYNILRLCSCAGSFEIRLVSLTFGSKKEFRPELRFCLKHFERRISHSGACTFGEVTLDAERLRSGAKIEFEFDWPSSFTLITEAWRAAENYKELIFHDGFQREGIMSGKNWNEETLVGENEFRMRIAYRVVCATNYYGPGCFKFCEPMSSSVGHFECTANGTLACSAGWEGSSCDTARCDNCINGACERPGSCRCKTGWSGPNCDQCMRYPGCKHGKCKQPNECICEEGWGGHFCSEDLNYCTRHRPCKNGATCRNTGHGQYTCECLNGYKGTNCETRIQNCSLEPCLNGATCIDESGNNYTCICPSGYTGRYCQITASSCSNSPCQNGATCTESHGRTFFCNCLAGWTGTTCDIRIEQCDNRVNCFNGGTCVEKGSEGTYECKCPLGFTGRYCEENVNECKQYNPCKNGGRCIDEINNYKCQCPDGFSGTLCQNVISACTNEPCINGAQCVDLEEGGYYCKCPHGFRGMNCEIVEIGCDRDPCKNGGTCVDSVQGFQCLCLPCFYGDSCSYLNSQCHSPVRHNRTTTFTVKIENEQVSSGGLNFRDLLLILLSSCCMLALMLIVTFFYRQKVAKRTVSIDPSLQNDFNSRRLSKYSEQKPCLSVYMSPDTEICYLEHDRTNKSEMVPDKQRLQSHPTNDDLDCSDRYAVEPVVNTRLPSLKQTVYAECCNKICLDPSIKINHEADLRHSRCCDVIHLPVSTPQLQDSDNYYEEIDNQPLAKVVVQQSNNDSDSGIVSQRATVPEDCLRR